MTELFIVSTIFQNVKNFIHQKFLKVLAKIESDNEKLRDFTMTKFLITRRLPGKRRRTESTDTCGARPRYPDHS